MKKNLLVFIIALTFSVAANASLVEAWQGMKEEAANVWEESKVIATEASETAKEIYLDAKEASAEKIKKGAEILGFEPIEPAEPIDPENNKRSYSVEEI